MIASPNGGDCGAEMGRNGMSTDKIRRLFLEFTRLRQKGCSRDEAWAGIEPVAQKLPSREHTRLLKMLRDWEAAEGHNYRPSGKGDLFETQYQKSDTAPARPNGGAARKSVIRRLPSSGPAQGVACPDCGKMNSPDARYCYGCGAPMGVAPSPKSGETQPVQSPEGTDAHFGEGMVLYLRVGSAQQMIRVVPRQDEMVIGRTSTESVMLPDVDLAPFQADTMGVSRLHATLRRHGDTLVLTDLGSLNHTYINGQQLHPHEVRVLHDGDEIRFGHLVARAYFRQE
jgi:hypothetical protein